MRTKNPFVAMPGVPTVFPKHCHKMGTDQVLWEVVLGKALGVTRSRNLLKTAQTKACSSESETSDRGRTHHAARALWAWGCCLKSHIKTSRGSARPSRATGLSLMRSLLFPSLVWLPFWLHISSPQRSLGI